MKKTFTYLSVTNKKNKNYGFIISKVKTTDSPKVSSAISIDPLSDGSWQLTINKSFLPDGISTIKLQTIDEDNIIKITGA